MAATSVLFNGIAAAVADVALNDMSRHSNFAHLRTYFEKRGILHAAAYAAVTVMVGAGAVLVATQLAFGYSIPSSLLEVSLTLAISFAIGYAMDVAIERTKLFRDLETYYRVHGSGTWGGLSLVVTMTLALAAQTYVLPHL